MYKQIAISLFLVIALVSCIPAGLSGDSGSARTEQAQTLAAQEIDSSAALQTQEALGAVQTSLASVKETQTALMRESPTPSLTPTFPTVMGTTTANVNCRSGPHSNFELVEIIARDTSVQVIGKNTDNTLWFQIETEDTTCWLSGDLLSLAGSADNVPEVASPPIPTGFYSAWVGQWTAWQNQCTGSSSSGCENTFTVTFSMIDARTVVGTYSTAGWNYTDVLTLSADGMRLDGPEYAKSGSLSYNFYVHLVMNPNLNQFTGQWNYVDDSSNNGYFKGARNGFPKP